MWTGRPGPATCATRLPGSPRAAAGTSFALEDVGVFDVYEGKGLPEGKKSLALSLAFRAPSRTLTDDEVNGVLHRIQEELGRTAAYQIRK